MLVVTSILARGKITEPFNVRTPKAAGEEPWPPLANLKTKGPSDFYSVRLTLRPGVHTGWHKHQGFVLTTVEQGTVTEYDESCQSRTYSGQRGGPVSVGDGFVDRGRTHILKNEGTTDVVLALFTIIPPGAPPFDSSPVAPCAVPELEAALTNRARGWWATAPGTVQPAGCSMRLRGAPLSGASAGTRFVTFFASTTKGVTRCCGPIVIRRLCAVNAIVPTRPRRWRWRLWRSCRQ
jgi:quercetin dioxygenase-like cupin family protein